MAVPKIANPYIAGSPISASEMFFGREDVFDFIRRAVVGKHRDNVIVLYGQRRTGKTSILYQLRRHLDDRYACIFIDLHGLALEGLGGFLFELASHIVRSLRRDYKIIITRPRLEDFLINPRGFFESEFLNEIWETIGERRILLMLDEAVRLQEQVQAGKIEAEIFTYLRHLMQHHERLNFLFSIGSGLEEMEKDYAFLFSVGLYIRISFLDRQSAIDLISEPVKDIYAVELMAIERILQITSGHPYYTQLLCHSLFSRWQKNQMQTIVVADIEAVLDEVIERGLAVLKHVWEESKPGEKLLLAGIAHAMANNQDLVSVAEIRDFWQKYDVFLPEGEITRSIQSLISREVITGRATYRFTIFLQMLWIQKYRLPEWVKEDVLQLVREWKPSNQLLPERNVGSAIEDDNSGRIVLPSSDHSKANVISPKFLLEMSQEALKGEHFDPAEEYLKQILNRDHNNVEATLQLADIALARARQAYSRGDNDGAQEHISSAITIHQRARAAPGYKGQGDNLAKQIESDAAEYFAAGGVAQRQGRLMLARDYFKRVSTASSYGPQARERIRALTLFIYALLAAGVLTSLLLLLLLRVFEKSPPRPEAFMATRTAAAAAAFGTSATAAIVVQATTQSMATQDPIAETTPAEALQTAQAETAQVLQAATAEAFQTAEAKVSQNATAEAQAATSSAAASQTATAQTQQPPPTNVPVPRSSPTQTHASARLSMAVQRTSTDGQASRCINVHIVFPKDYTGNGWTLIAEDLGSVSSFNAGGYAALCVSNERQEFRFSMLPPPGIRISGNRSIPARGGDSFIAYAK